MNEEFVGPFEVVVLVTSIHWREYVPVNVSVDYVRPTKLAPVVFLEDWKVDIRAEG